MDTVPPPPPAAAATAPAASGTDDKTIGLLSYLTFIGWIVALVLRNQNATKTSASAFHLRQSLGLHLTGFAGWIGIWIVCIILAFIPVLGLILAPLCWLAFLISMVVLWVIGFIGAINGQQKLVPVLGPLYQKIFANAFV